MSVDLDKIEVLVKRYIKFDKEDYYKGEEEPESLMAAVNYFKYELSCGADFANFKEMIYLLKEFEKLEKDVKWRKPDEVSK